MSNSEAEFQISNVEVTETRTVTMAVRTSTVLPGWTAQFRPDRLVISYRNGKPYQAALSGPAIRIDGHRYENGVRGHRAYGLTGDTPEWIMAEVNRHMPKGV